MRTEEIMATVDRALAAESDEVFLEVMEPIFDDGKALEVLLQEGSDKALKAAMRIRRVLAAVRDHHRAAWTHLNDIVSTLDATLDSKPLIQAP